MNNLKVSSLNITKEQTEKIITAFANQTMQILVNNIKNNEIDLDKPYLKLNYNLKFDEKLELISSFSNHKATKNIIEAFLKFTQNSVLLIDNNELKFLSQNKNFTDGFMERIKNEEFVDFKENPPYFQLEFPIILNAFDVNNPNFRENIKGKYLFYVSPLFVNKAESKGFYQILVGFDFGNFKLTQIKSEMKIQIDGMTFNVKPGSKPDFELTGNQKVTFNENKFGLLDLFLNEMKNLIETEAININPETDPTTTEQKKIAAKSIQLQNGTALAIFNCLKENKGKSIDREYIKSAILKLNLTDDAFNIYIGNIRNQLAILTNEKKLSFCPEDDYGSFFCNIPENINAVSKVTKKVFIPK